MLSPFKEENLSRDNDEILVNEILEGNANALETLILRHQAWIYNIAFKTIMDHSDAEDITQEVLIKIISRLRSYDPEKGAFRTWLYRIVINHIINMKKKKFEHRIQSFGQYVSLLEKIPDDKDCTHPETAVLTGELKIGCMMGMTLCLNRQDRIAFLLGAVFEIRDRQGAAVMDISPENFRQKLSRSRKKVFNYMNGICGHVNADNPCRCSAKIKTFANMGMLDANILRFHRPEGKTVRQVMEQRVKRFEDTYYEPFLRHFRNQPFYDCPDMAGRLKKMINSEDFNDFFTL